MSGNSNKKKGEQLGMPIGTAQAILRKKVLFNLIVLLGLNKCFQCGEQIDNVNDLSIEHKIPWLDSDDPKGLFFNLENIAFSHLKCNSKARRDNSQLKKESLRGRVLKEQYKNCLSIDKVLKIKQLLQTHTRKEVEEIMGVSKTAIAKIARNETYAYINA